MFVTSLGNYKLFYQLKCEEQDRFLESHGGLPRVRNLNQIDLILKKKTCLTSPPHPFKSPEVKEKE